MSQMIEIIIPDNHRMTFTNIEEEFVTVDTGRDNTDRMNF